MTSTKLEKQYIADLRGIFEAQGPQLYEGQHSLCLTNLCLHHLLKRLSLTEDESAEDQYSGLHQILDCMGRVQSLKLIVDRKATIAPSLLTLDITAFKSLQELTLRRIPINSLFGLQRVRGQLRYLVVERCGVNDIEDVIVRCGHDEAHPFLWNSLKELDLSANSIQAVGDAMQYIPHLERVNLSNNKIGPGDWEASSSSHDDRQLCVQATSGIKYIDSVQWLHLGYNQLVCLPQFGDGAIYNLTSLILRNNSLTDINGMEVLNALIELDVGENLIGHCQVLWPLKNLQNLTQLTLVGNPLTFDPKYRLKVAGHLSGIRDSDTFSLDGKKLSSSEKKAIPHSQTTPPRWTTPTTSLSLSGGKSTDLVSSVNISGQGSSGNHGNGKGTPSQLPNPSPSNVKPQEHKKSSSSRPVRLITLEEDEDASLLSTPLKHGDKIRQDQVLRSQMKDSWLPTSTVTAIKAKTARELFVDSESNQRELEATTSTDISQSLSKADSQSIGYSIVKTQAETSSVVDTGPGTRPDFSSGSHSTGSGSHSTGSGSHSIGSGSHSTGSGSHSTGSGSHSTSPPITRFPKQVITPEADTVAVSHSKRKKKNKKRSSQSNLPKVVEGNIETGELPENRACSDKEGVTKEGVAKDDVAKEGVVIAELSDNNEQMDGANIGEGMFDMEDSTDKQISYSPKVKAIVSAEVFQVAVYDSGSEDDGDSPFVFMTLSERFIQEVTLNGEVQDQLDLQCLISAKVKTRTHKNTRSRVVVLNFNYERRDRRKREYLLMDTKDEVRIMEVLGPVIEQNSTDVSIATKLECLKCQVVIDWSEALEDPLDSPRPLTPRGSYPSQDKSTHNRQCPHCKGGILMLQSGGGGEHSGGPHRSSLSHTQTPPLSSNHNLVKQSFGFHTTTTPEPSQGGPLSPGHLDVSLFDTYPDQASGCGLTNETGATSLLDSAPFSTKSKSSNKGVGVANDQLTKGVSHQLITSNTLESYSEDPHGKNPDVTAEELIQVSKNSSDEGYSSHKPRPLTNELLSDDNPLYSGSDWESEEKRNSAHQNQPDSAHYGRWNPIRDDISHTHIESAHSRPHPNRSYNNSPLLSHFKPGANSIERESDLGKSRPLSIATPPNSSPISASVPSDSPGFMSYFRKKPSHSRTKSQDLQKISLLPEGVAQGTKGRFQPGSPVLPHLRTNGSSQSSLTPDTKGLNKSNDKTSSGEDKHSSGSGSRFNRLSKKYRLTTKGKKKSSSEAEEGRPLCADLVLYRTTDPTHLHNNLVLHFTMNVFEDKETFQLALRAPVICYGDWDEIECFLIASNQKMYLYRVIGPENLVPETWLEDMCVLNLNEVVFVEIGVCYQSLRLEFDNPARCYTFMIGIEDSCRKIYEILSYIASDLPGNLFNGIRVTQFSLAHLTDPHEVLKENILVHYSKTVKSSMDKASRASPDEELKVFVLVHKCNHGNSDQAKVLATLVLTDKCVYLGLQNPQWPLPSLPLLPNKGDLLPPYSGVTRRDISDVEKLILYDDDSLQMTIVFFSENNQQCSWTVILRCSKSMKKFISCLRSAWSQQVQLQLPVVSK